MHDAEFMKDLYKKVEYLAQYFPQEITKKDLERLQRIVNSELFKQKMTKGIIDESFSVQGRPVRSVEEHRNVPAVVKRK